MKSHYLLIETCNYTDYPIGGHLSFAKQLVKAFGNDLALVGITTDDETPIGVWTKKVIGEVEFDFFSIKRTNNKFNKSIIPNRIKSYLWIKKYQRKILKYGCVNLIVQTPETFLPFAFDKRLNICLRLAGLENPLKISKYLAILSITIIINLSTLA